MRPHNPKPSKRSADKALQTTIQHRLAWLRGFPLDGMNWQVVGQDRGQNDPIIVLDRSRLRASQYALRSIPRRFPKALPRRYQSTERWQRSVREKLDPIIRFIHEEGTLPHWSQLPQAAPVIDQAQSLARRLPRFEPLNHAVFWTYWNDAKSTRAALAFLERFEKSFGYWLEYKKTPVELDFLRLFRLYQCQPECLTSILQRFASRDSWILRLEQGSIVRSLREQIQSLPRFMQCLEDPDSLYCPADIRKYKRRGPQSALEIFELLPTLTLRSPGDQKNALILIEALLPGESLVELWSEWWFRLEEFTKGLPKPGPPDRGPTQCPKSQINALRKQFSKIEQGGPRAFTRDDNFHLTRNVLSEWRGPAAEAASGILSMLQDKDRRAWIENWHCEFRSWERCLVLIFRELRKFWENSNGVENWRLWSGVSPYRLATELWDLYDEDGGGLSKKELRRLLQVMKGSIKRDLAKTDYEAPSEFYKCLGFFRALTGLKWPSDKLARLASHVSSQNRRELTPGMLRLNWWLAEQNEALFASLMASSSSVNTLRDSKALALLEQCPRSAGRFREGLFSQHRRLAQSLLNMTLLYIELLPKKTLAVLQSWTEPSSPVRMGWAEDYPEELRQEIFSLCRWDSDAKKSLVKILGKDCPQVEAIKRELAALEFLAEQRAVSESQRLRIQSLKERLQERKKLSVARLERLKEKLRSRTLLAQFRRLEELFQQILKESDEECAIYLQVIDKLGMKWLSPLLAIRGLKPRWRKLGEDVLRRRLSDEPWNFIDKTRNANFVIEMEKAGVKMAPWLNETTVTKTGDWSLRLERDPLEILLMGEHFSTCLSPFDINFFSTLANCLDINKQVLYARDRSGQMQGRCLLALSQSGQMLHYEIYCHGQESLRAAIQTYIAQLAEQMSTELAQTGQVQRLVAPSWYDDGVVCPENKALDSIILRLEEQLRDDEPSLSLTALEAEFGPLKLNLLRELLSRPMFSISPKLLGIFFEARPQWLLEPTLHYEALLWAEFKGDHALLKELLTAIEKSHSWRPWSEDRIIQLPRLWLQLGETAKALRFLRKTPWNTRDECEESQERLLLWGECYAAVRRPMKALAYYKRLLYGGCLGTLKKRADVLEGQLMSLLNLKAEEGDSHPLLRYKRKRSLPGN